MPYNFSISQYLISTSQYPNIQYLIIMTRNNSKQAIHLYFGEDDFTIAEKIKKDKELFEKKFGGINIFEIDWQDQNISEEEKLSRLQNGLMANSLFSSDKLLILKNIFYSAKNEVDGDETGRNTDGGRKEKLVLKYFKNPQKSAKIFFIESNLDKRKKVYKELAMLEKTGIAEIREFSVPAGPYFDKWVKSRIEKSGGKIGKEAIDILAISLGRGLVQKDKKGNVKQSYDLWETSNEIEKLVSYCGGREIAKNDIELLVKSKVDMNIFNLIDKISSKDKIKSALLLNAQIEKGLNEIYILTMLVYQFRNLLKVKSLLNQGMSSSEIIARTKMHPFVARKSIQQCGRFKMEDLKKIYKKLFDADATIKTGKMDPRLVLDLLVISV